MKVFLKYLLKICVAGIISLIILSLFSLVYYNPPVAIPQSNGTTNFKYSSNSNWSFMLEGSGYGKINNQGYNSAYYSDCSNPDIVFVGSSHMEALQVPQDKNFVYLLNQKFDKDNLPYNNYKCLNLGISGHFFEVTASNYQNIATQFKCAKYAVIEVTSVEYTSQMLDDIIACKFSAPMEEKGIIHNLAQNIPFVRLMYKKINETSSAQGASTTDTAPSSAKPDMGVYAEKMNTILGRISKLSAQNNIVPIVLMHERFWEDQNGNIIMELNDTYKTAFKKCCQDNGIKVIDISSEMVSAYKNNHEFSYGFSNTAPGEGHLNKTGHRIVAETVYKFINEMEAQK